MPTTTTALLLFAAALAVAYGAAFVLRAPSWPGSLVKTGSVALLAIAGPSLGAPSPVTAGLALGAAGDFFLSRPGERAFLAGMVAFGLGHLFYAAAAWDGAPLLIPTLAVVALVGSTERWLIPHTGRLRWPVRAYAAIIGLMAVAVLTRGPTAPALTAGAALFLLSDVLLALDRFARATRPGSRAGLKRLVWACYWTGQALILWSAAGL